uniref:THAP domain-containing protein 2-like n=1 Tax=Pristiophorus japonicus TaxID=55135 RepID=UPI00398F4FC3
MPTSCAAYGCSAVYKKNTDTSFHRFPSNPGRRTEWIRRVRRVNFKPSKHTFLCSKHFEQPCFDRTGQTRRLREDAVPTIFDFPPQIQKKLADRKSRLDAEELSKSQQSNTISTVQFASVGTNTTGIWRGTSGNKVVFQEHSYCLANPVAAKRKIFQLQDEVDYLRQQIKISRQRERRVVKKWKGISTLLVELKEKNLLPSGQGVELIQAALSDDSFKDM